VRSAPRRTCARLKQKVSHSRERTSPIAIKSFASPVGVAYKDRDLTVGAMLGGPALSIGFDDSLSNVELTNV